jgi:hypothetical protein
MPETHSRKAGAQGYVLKGLIIKESLHTIRAIYDCIKWTMCNDYSQRFLTAGRAGRCSCCGLSARHRFYSIRSHSYAALVIPLLSHRSYRRSHPQFF